MSGSSPELAQTPRRRWWRWLVAVLVAVPVVVAALVLWVFLTASGRDTALTQALRFLPPDALSWRSAEGHLSGGLVLHEVRYQADGLSIDLARVELDLSASALLTGDIRIRRILLADGRIDLSASEPVDTSWPAQIELPKALPDLVLPVSIRIDTLAVHDVTFTQDAELLLEVRRLTSAAELQRGVLHLRKLALDSDLISLALDARIDTPRAWSSDIKAQGHWLIEGAEPLPFGLRIKGDLDDLRLTAETDVGQPALVQFRARGGLPKPTWTLQLDAPEVLPERLGASGAPIGLTLKADGDLAQARIEGQFAQDGFVISLLPSTMSYRDTAFALAPLAVATLDGSAELSGEVALSGDTPDLTLALIWQDITLPAEAGDATVKTRGSAQVRGPLDDYALTLDGVFVRDASEAIVTLEGRGSTRDLTLNALRAELPGGHLQATGNVAWDPEVRATLDAQLQAFDPSYFVPALPGSINAHLALTGGLGDAGPYGALTLDDLSGHLRERALAGSAQVQMDSDGHGQGEADLQLGRSHVKAQGRWDEQLDLEVLVESLMLADLTPDAAGQLDGQVTLRGPRNTPRLSVQLDGKNIAYAEHKIRSLALRGTVDNWDSGVISLEAETLTLGGQKVDSLSLSGEGSRAKHDAALVVSGPAGAFGLELAGSLHSDNSAWQGTLHDLYLEPAERAAWRQRDTAQLGYNVATGQLTLSQTCLDAAPASLCAQIEQRGAASEGEIELKGLNLAELDPLLVALLDQPAALSGELVAYASFSRDAAGTVNGDANISIPRLGIKLDPAAERDLLDVTDLQLTATLDPENARFELDAKTSADGFIRLQLLAATPLEEDGELSGHADLQLSDLAVLELFTNEVVNPTGRLEGRLAIAGARSAPRLDGTLELLDFAAELPALGIAPRDGQITLSSSNSQEARLSGSIRLGDGTAQIDGHLDLAAEGGPAGKLTITGENLTLMAVPQAQVRASPDLSMELSPGVLKVRGSVDIPYARIDLERLESVDTPSSDVIIIDDDAVTAGPAVDTDVTVIFGDDVRMNGFGLKGTLDGRLRVRDSPGRATTARGAIEVGGAYKAYGQDLRITRGHVSYAATPLDTPALDIRAERKIDAITVGVQVRGTALVPEMTLWSNPTMEQAEQLSYLVLGRPLRSASQAEGGELSQAAAAMGGNLLAKNLGARLGLDEVEVADSRALGGAALMVGMNLSPRLHVSYGVALFDSGQIVTFKYLLSQLWNIQIDSGSENRATLNYRLER